MACTEAARGESESYRCESAESADCEGLKLVPGDRHGRGRATAGACCNSAGPGVLLRTPHSLPLLFCVVFRSMRFPGLAFLYPSIPISVARSAKNRDVPTPRCPGDRYSIGYSPIARRGDAGTPRTPAPRGAATQRAGTGRRRDRTDLSTEASRPTKKRNSISVDTIVIPLLTSQRSAHSSGPG